MPGAFVKVTATPYCDYGIGKLVRTQGAQAVVVYFDFPDEIDPTEVLVPAADLRAVDMTPQTRVFRIAPGSHRWQVGRVLDGTDDQVLVQFPNKDIVNVAREDLQIRWRRPIADPMAFLIREVSETPRFSQARSAFIRAVTAQRAACHGIGAVLSSRIQLTEYQFNVVLRVLEDPIQRYLLADEVGLGKTIEAGLLVRQYVLDEPESARVLIVVPPALVSQWKEELVTRFGLSAWLDDFVHVVSSDNLGAIRSHIASAGMLVIDEAHHLSRGDTPGDLELYELLRDHAHRITRLLLLSATPVLADTAGFLKMLHLLDPIVFPLDDLAGFERRLESRQLVAETVAALVPENLFVLEGELDRLVGAFEDDVTLVHLVSQLRPIVQALPDEQDDQFLQALGALRVYLTETYRLHRRILRNRRKAVPWATPQRSGLKVVTYRCEATAERCRLLEALRTHLANSIDASPAVQIILFQAAVHPTASVELVEVFQRHGIADRGALGLAHQVDRLSVQVRLEAARTTAAVTAVQGLLQRPSVQVVVFCDQKVDADRVGEALELAMPGTVQRHDPGVTAEDDEDSNVEPWRQFLTDPNRFKILVCDARAEEGLNLHGGKKVAVHFDLPVSPNRIEQRLGRLDRFGAGDAVQSVAFVCSENPDETSWMQCLRDGLEVFDESMASLQYLVEEAFRPVVNRWAGEGVGAIHALIQILSGPKGLVARERRRIDQQDALDALSEEPIEAFDALETIDGEWLSWRKAFDGFANETLQFGKRAERWSGPLPAQEQVFRLAYATEGPRQTLLPQATYISDFLGTIDIAAPGGHARNPLTHAYSFRRSTALTREGQKLGVRPVRYGDPIVEALCSFCESDDRGRVFAMWRHLPNYRAIDSSGTDLCYRFDYLVEAEIVESKPSTPRFGIGDLSVLRALRRRADAEFAPKFISVWIGLDGIATAAAPPDVESAYRLNDSTECGRDYNLNAQRWQILHAQSDMPWLIDWKLHCELASQRAEKFVLSMPEVKAHIASAVQTTRRRHDVRQAQLAARIARLNGAAKDAEVLELEREVTLHESLIHAITQPALKLDVVGATFVSARTPFLP